MIRLQSIAKEKPNGLINLRINTSLMLTIFNKIMIKVKENEKKINISLQPIYDSE